MTTNNTGLRANDGEQHLPVDVSIVTLNCHSDDRGALVELYRQEWIGKAERTVQWNHVVSRPNVLRGIHVHHTHWDYLYMAQGGMELALIDIRRESPDVGMTRVVQLHADHPRAVIIPPGVAHGFYFADSAVLIYGVTHYWNKDDELGCKWDDPALDIPWAARTPVVSACDQAAGSFEQMIRDYEERTAPVDTTP